MFRRDPFLSIILFLTVMHEILLKGNMLLHLYRSLFFFLSILVTSFIQSLIQYLVIVSDLELGVKITGIKKQYQITNLIRISKKEKGYYYIINSHYR